MVRKPAMKPRLACAAALLFAGLVLCSPTVRAETLEEKAKKHFHQGVALYNEGNEKAALIEFKASFKANKNWRVRYYIGLSNHALHRFVDAETELKAYLEEGGDRISDDKKEHVQSLLTELAGVIGTVKIACNVDDASVKVNGKYHGKTPLAGPIRLNIGDYEVKVEKEGYNGASIEIELPGGEVISLDMDLEKEKPPEEEIKQPDPVKEIKPLPGEIVDEEEKAGKKKKKTVKPRAFYGVMGTTGVLILGVIVTGAMALDKYIEFGETDKSDIPTRRELRDTGRRLTWSTDALLGVSAVFAITTIVLGVYTNFDKKEKKKTSRLPSIQLGGPSIMFKQTF